MELVEVISSQPLSMILHWQGTELHHIDLRWAKTEEREQIHSKYGRLLHDALQSYVSGQAVGWPSLPLQMSGLSPFTRATLEELNKIPHGQTLSYASLAAKIGRPKAARGIGQVMARNRWPLLLPCHRVLRSDGKLGGFGPGLPMKKWLLALEASKNPLPRLF